MRDAAPLTRRPGLFGNRTLANAVPPCFNPVMRSRGAIEPTKENGVAIPEAADAPPAIAA